MHSMKILSSDSGHKYMGNAQYSVFVSRSMHSS